LDVAAQHGPHCACRARGTTAGALGRGAANKMRPLPHHLELKLTLSLHSSAQDRKSIALHTSRDHQ
jgi:hypothetical protein